MSTVVHKYGGTSMGTIEKIKSVAKKVILEKEKGNDVVVVVSAMGKTTNKLIELAKEISTSPNKREFDVLLSTGEQISISLLAIAIQSLGYDAISFTGYQVGIKTKGIHSKSEIDSIDIDKIKEHLEQGKIVIIAGFQGVNESGDITTLGRGGSDTTAVALAAALGCNCIIYTDVEGIYSIDPNLYPNAKKIDYIGYKEMIEMARLGAGVMEMTSVEIGYRKNVPVYVTSSIKNTNGTYIIENKDSNINCKSIIGIAIDDNTSILTIKNILSKSNDISLIFEILSKENLELKMINQINFDSKHINISFVVDKGDLGCLEKAINKIKSQLNYQEVYKNSDVSTISLIGKNINYDTINKIFNILKKNDIDFMQVFRSELSISFIVDNKYRQSFIELLGSEFDL